MEPITIAGMKIAGMTLPEAVGARYQAFVYEYRKSLINGIIDFREKIRSSHVLLQNEFKGTEVVAVSAHATLTAMDEVASSVYDNILHKEVSYAALHTCADSIVKIGVALQETMTMLGF